MDWGRVSPALLFGITISNAIQPCTRQRNVPFNAWTTKSVKPTSGMHHHHALTLLKVPDPYFQLMQLRFNLVNMLVVVVINKPRYETTVISSYLEISSGYSSGNNCASYWSLLYTISNGMQSWGKRASTTPSYSMHAIFMATQVNDLWIIPSPSLVMVKLSYRSSDLPKDLWVSLAAPNLPMEGIKRAVSVSILIKHLCSYISHALSHHNSCGFKWSFRILLNWGTTLTKTVDLYGSTLASCHRKGTWTKQMLRQLCQQECTIM